MLVLTAQEMAGFDHKTINTIGIPGIVLMENAARGAAEFFLDFFLTFSIPGLPLWPAAATMRETDLCWLEFFTLVERRFVSFAFVIRPGFPVMR